MRHGWLAVLAVAGCGRSNTPPQRDSAPVAPAVQADTLADSSAWIQTPAPPTSPSFATAPALAFRIDTTVLGDGRRHFERWKMDSTWEDPLALGIPFGTFSLPVDSVGRQGFTGVIMVGDASNIRRTLDLLRSRHGRVVLQIARSKMRDAAGNLSVSAAAAELDRWKAAIDLAAYIRDSTVHGIMVGDDPELNGSGGWGLPAYDSKTAAGLAALQVRYARFDSTARAVKVRWPEAAAIMRDKPTSLARYKGGWKWLDAGYAQYNGPYRDGRPEDYAAKQLAAAKALGLKVVVALNVLDGGCGPVSLGACLVGIPGTAIEGTYKNAAGIRRYQMSAPEVLAYGTTFAKLPENCGLWGWRWSPNYQSSTPTPVQLAGIRAFNTRPDVQLALKGVAAVAAVHPYTSCRSR